MATRVSSTKAANEKDSVESEGVRRWRAELSARVDRMQTPEWRAAMEAMMNATPEEMGRAAVEVAAARKRARGNGA